MMHLNALAACSADTESLVTEETTKEVRVSIGEVTCECIFWSGGIAALLSACRCVLLQLAVSLPLF